MINEGVGTGNEERQAVAQLQTAFKNFRLAWYELQYAVSNIYIEDVNEYIAESYPFKQSFDEIDSIPEWIDICLEKLQ